MNQILIEKLEMRNKLIFNYIIRKEAIQILKRYFEVKLLMLVFKRQSQHKALCLREDSKVTWLETL
jgi:hypothetical protein